MNRHISLLQAVQATTALCLCVDDVRPSIYLYFFHLFFSFPHQTIIIAPFDLWDLHFIYKCDQNCVFVRPAARPSFVP